MPRQATDVGLVGAGSGVDPRDKLGGRSLRDAGVGQIGRRGDRACRGQRAAGGCGIGRAVGRRTSQHNTGYDGMHEDRQRIAGDAIEACRDIGDARLIGGGAVGEVGNATAGVAVPRSRAEPAGVWLDVGDGHVRGAVGVCPHRDARALAVCGCRPLELSDLREVQRDAIGDGLQRDGGGLGRGHAGVAAIAEGGREIVRAARDRDTEWDRRQKQNRQRDKPTH